MGSAESWNNTRLGSVSGSVVWLRMKWTEDGVMIPVTS